MVFSALNRVLFKRTSTMMLTVAVGSFFFERAFELTSQTIFESINKGKLWKDIKDKVTQGGGGGGEDEE